jgi:hypothetical protein
VRPLDLPPGLREIASSTVRAAVAEGDQPDETVPPIVAAFMEETGLYSDEARYQARCNVIDEAVHAASRNLRLR